MNIKYLSRVEAADYLLDKWGEPGAVTAKTLAKMAVVGGGPKFCRFGRKPAYTPEWLDEWAIERMSAVVTSTSDPALDPVA